MASVAPQTRIAPPHVHWGVLDFKALRIRSALVHALRVAMATAVLIRTPAQVNVCLERSQLPVRSSATIALQVNFRSVAQPRALRVPLDNIPIVVLRRTLYVVLESVTLIHPQRQTRITNLVSGKVILVMQPWLYVVM